MLMQWGTFRFEINTAAYQELQRSQAWRWPSQQPVGAPPLRQAVGIGDDTVRLSGVILPYYRGGYNQLKNIRALADSMAAYQLVDGNGLAWGRFACTELTESQTNFDTLGTPKRQEFSLSLVRA